MENNDPFAKREAANYAKPIPSREFILDILKGSKGPMRHEELCEALSLDDEDSIEALRRRLIAMERDGQVVSNRRRAYGCVEKMDLVKGRVIAHRDGYGFVSLDAGGDDVYLSQRQMRKVFDGDEVLVRLGYTNSRGQREGAIVEVLARHTQRIVGQFVSEFGNSYVMADNPKVQHDILVDKENSLNAQHGQIVVVELLRQPDRNKRPAGKVIEILGNHMAPGMEIDVAIRSYDIPHVWPESVVAESDQISSEVKEKDKKRRVDLRELALITIDGEDARDFDDAVYCEKKPSGGWRLFVAIADVSHYVGVETPLDQEAQRRGNSVYFPNHVVPMLPEKLSNGLCSLNPAVDRLCMVCEMTISAAGRISGYQFYEAVMHSKARMTYTEVGKILEERERKSKPTRNAYSELLPHIDELHALYHALRAERSRRGAIDFEGNETRIIFDRDRKIKKIVPVHRNDAHKIIEECMLAANVCSARFLEAHEIPALYRVHEPPKSEKLENLLAFLSEMGLHMPATDVVQPEHYQAVMKQVEGQPIAQLVQSVMLRSMNQAVYQSNNMGHFGLAYKAYTHFTSPIRRYPDLLVHRAIRSIIRSKVESSRVRRVASAKPLKKEVIYPYSDSTVEQFGQQCSQTERRADEATRDVVSWLKCEYLQDRVGEAFDGVISGVTGFGFFVELKDIYVDGLVHVTSLPHDYYRFHAAQHRLVGERTRKVFRVGDSVNVTVMRVSLDERKIDFELNSKRRSSRVKAAVEVDNTGGQERTIRKRSAPKAQPEQKNKGADKTKKKSKPKKAKPNKKNTKAKKIKKPKK